MNLPTFVKGGIDIDFSHDETGSVASLCYRFFIGVLFAGTVFRYILLSQGRSHDKSISHEVGHLTLTLFEYVHLSEVLKMAS